MSAALDPQLQKLRGLLADMGSVLVCYSGGVDSALVLAVAHEVLGPKAIGMTAVSPSLAPFEKELAISVARRIGARHERATRSARANRGPRSRASSSWLATSPRAAPRLRHVRIAASRLRRIRRRNRRAHRGRKERARKGVRGARDDRRCRTPLRFQLRDARFGGLPNGQPQRGPRRRRASLAARCVAAFAPKETGFAAKNLR